MPSLSETAITVIAAAAVLIAALFFSSAASFLGITTWPESFARFTVRDELV
jgi:hypothetical protein